MPSCRGQRQSYLVYFLSFPFFFFIYFLLSLVHLLLTFLMPYIFSFLSYYAFISVRSCNVPRSSSTCVLGDEKLQMFLFLCPYPCAATVKSTSSFLPSVCKHETTLERLRPIFIEFDLEISVNIRLPFPIFGLSRTKITSTTM